MAFAGSFVFKIWKKLINKSLSINILIKLACFCYCCWNHIKLLIIKFNVIYILIFFCLNLFQLFTDLLYLHNIQIMSFFLHLSIEALSVFMLIIRKHLNNLYIYCIAVMREMLKLLSLFKTMLFAKILKTFQKVSNILFFKQGRILCACQWHK